MEPAAIRKFDSGATRDMDTNKLDYEGFFSPVVMQRYAEYMHRNRRMLDGSLRASDNWQKGIPIEQYMKSLARHFMEVWLWKRGMPIKDTISNALCGVMFNAMGMLFEMIKEDLQNEKCN